MLNFFFLQKIQAGLLKLNLRLAPTLYMFYFVPSTSHQFPFHTLGEDYHALIRRHQFDICGEEIKVRKQIEISAYSSGGGGPGNHNHNSNNNSTFIEGFSAPRDIRRISSSFDEPIASAISGSFDHSNLPIILPMYPNGRIPGGQHNSFRNSIPIRTMAGIG